MSAGVPRPPRLAERLLGLTVRRVDRDAALADACEEFEQRAARDGVRSARRWYWRQAVTSAPAISTRRLSGAAVSRDARWRSMAFQDLRWAWRGLRSRGWRALFVVLLLGVALGANAIVFAAADSFVFHTVPYPEPERLAVIEHTSPYVISSVSQSEYVEWRRHPELFANVEFFSDYIPHYVTIAGVVEGIRAAQVTPRVFPMLGVLPRWGRPFVESDALPGAAPVAIITPDLATRLFATPDAAVGRTFQSDAQIVTVVGVMPQSFRFPSAPYQIWTPFDVATWEPITSYKDIVRLAPGQTIASATAAVSALSASVLEATGGRRRGDSLQLRSWQAAHGNDGAAQIFAMLVGAASCLLLIACANVASLEIAGASARQRVDAIRSALGASRASLIRICLLEGALMLTLSGFVAIAMATWGTRAVAAALTRPMSDALAKPIVVDVRGLLFMLGIATATWLATTLPTIIRLSRLSVTDGLRDDTRTMPVTRAAARARGVLMIGQVALTVLLLVGSLLYVRTYAAKLGIDKGFDADHLVTVVAWPAGGSGIELKPLTTAILDRVRAIPGVFGVSNVDALPPTTQAGVIGPLTIDDRLPTTERVKLHMVACDPAYFQTIRMPIVAGSAFDASSRPEDVVIDERFARAYWPAGAAVGSFFNFGKGGFGHINRFHIVGVSRAVAVDQELDASGAGVFVAYMPFTDKYAAPTFIARVDSDARAADVLAAVRSVAGRSLVLVSTIDAQYAKLAADTRLAATVITAFGLVALLVATSGVYAVMAFLVAGRSKEIAIRLALGADAQRVRRVVLGSALRFAVVGAALGLIAAGVASHWIASQLFGVSGTDPLTYGAVLATILVTTVVATWRPARRASRIDPAVTLRAN